jgi:hypothetical protein
MITTTLNKIRAHSSCEKGWNELISHLGKTYTDDEPLKFSAIVEGSGIIDALICLNSVRSEYEKDVCMFYADCAEALLVYSEQINDSLKQKIQLAREFINGNVSENDDCLYAYGVCVKLVVDAAGAAEAMPHSKVFGDIIIKMLTERFS